MTRFTLIAPLLNNDGLPMPAMHASLESQLVGKFGGFTVHAARGGWQGYREDVKVYTVDTDSSFAHGAMVELAHYVKDAADQEAVYLTASRIDVNLV